MPTYDPFASTNRFRTRATELKGDPIQQRLLQTDGSPKTDVNEDEILALWNRFIQSANANPEGRRAKWLADTRFGKEGVPQDSKVGTAMLRKLKKSGLLGDAGSATLKSLFRRKPPGQTTQDPPIVDTSKGTGVVTDEAGATPSWWRRGRGVEVWDPSNEVNDYQTEDGYSDPQRDQNYVNPDRLQDTLLNRANPEDFYHV